MDRVVLAFLLAFVFYGLDFLIEKIRDRKQEFLLLFMYFLSLIYIIFILYYAAVGING